MSSPKTYTAQDIERYHQGGMSAAERHLLEKAALDDPMLADALEGYVHTTSASADLGNLQSRLKQRVEEKKEGKLFSFSNQWMKIAALFVLIAGGGWLVFYTLSDRTTNRASRAETVETLDRATATDSVATVQTETSSLISDSILRSDEIVASGTIRSKAAPSATANTAAPLTIMADAPGEGKTEAPTTEQVSANQPPPSDMARLRSSAPASTRREAADTSRLLDAAQLRKNESLTEINADKRMPAARAKVAIPENAEPEGGWPAFEKYITENRKPVEAGKQKAAMPREVELQFDVDKTGRPINIKVIEPVCPACDAEAIRLLKEGPKWKGQTGTVKIPLSPKG